MKKKYYAVRKGVKTGIFDSWAECEAQVKGYSSAEYKSFSTREEAENYINGGKEGIKDNHIEKLKPKEMVAYVDGSFDQKSGYYGYGGVIFTKGRKEIFQGKGNEEGMAEMRNVAGEIKASMVAMEKALEKGMETLYIYYDYAGIEKWCTGEWKRNKIDTGKYKEYCDVIKEKLNLIFIKVEAHSGNKYNDEADRQAKEAIGLM
ncbi:MAG TPA: ribonuclease H family protein [Tissierellales bacterium]|nr:ribonuclease H family protein [Tissierellales bacterium]